MSETTCTSPLQSDPASKSPRSGRRGDSLGLVAALLVGFAIFAVMPVSRMMSAKNDFVHWYVGGLLFGTPDLHIQEANQQKQRELIGDVLSDSYFIRPTFYALLLKPLTFFSYKTAYLVFQAFSLLCLAVFLRIYSRKWPELLTHAAMSIPVICNLVNGQDVTLLLLFCTVSLVLASRGKDFASGLVFSLCAIKFHLFILTPVAMVAKRRWGIFFGALAGEIVLFLLGLTGGGWKVFLSLVALLNKPENHPYPEVMPNLRGLVYSVAGGSVPLLIFLCIIVLLLTLYLIIKAPTYEKGFAFALIGGLLLNFHAYIQDPMLLLLTSALLLDGTESKVFRLLTQFILLPVPYLLLLYGPPYSGMFALLLIASLIIAIRDRRNASLPAQPAATYTPAIGAHQNI